MSKIGPRNVNPSSKGSSPTHVVAGGPGHSFAQQPIPGPTSTGQPKSMKKALSKSPQRGMATGFPGKVR
jgi:hypothetical protein